MGKLERIVIAGTMSLGMFSGVAFAQTAADPCTGQGNATISNTGPDSTNTITCTNNVTTTFRCTNGVLINTVNNQAANSGNATSGGNTTGGGATTGPALNDNQTTLDIHASCAAAVANPAPAPVTPAAGRGSGQAATPAASAPSASASTPAAVKTLPNTGENDLAMQASVGALALGSLAAVVQLAVSGYRRFSLGRM